MNLNDVANEALSLVKNEGFENAQVRVSKNEVQELELNETKVNLCRTNGGFSVSIKVVKDHKQFEVSGNNWTDASKKILIEDLKKGWEASSEDEAYGILESSDKKSFQDTSKPMEMEKALGKIMEFSQTTSAKYPKVKIRNLPLKGIQEETLFKNSHGMELSQKESYWSYFTMFSGQDGDKVSSFNYVGFQTQNLPEDLLNSPGLEHVLCLAEREPHAEAHTEEIKGDVVLSPYLVQDFLGFVLGQMSTGALVQGTSLFKDKLGQRVMSDKISLTSHPMAEEFATKAPFSSEGVLLEEGDLIRNGELKRFLINLYGSNKLDLPLSKVLATHLKMNRGEKTLDEMIQGINKGLLVMRFSGGSPSANGDFSGVAKNSFLIENGKISRPVKEVMIAGNILDLFKNVVDLSREAVNDGSSETPWIHTKI